MDRRVGLFATAAIALPLMIAAPGARAADDSNVDTVTAGASNPGAEAVRNLALAQQLAQYARSKKDALLMIAAAKLTKDASAHDSKRDKQAEASGDDDDGAAPAAGAAPGAPALSVPPPAAKAGLPKTDQDAVTALLGEARTLAGDRKELVAMIDEVAQITRGAVGGPKRSYDWVNPRSADVYRIRYRAGQLATVGIITGDNPALSLQVNDENGHRICTDHYDGTGALLCRWVPRWQGAFVIRVRNHSHYEGEYVLVTN